MPGASPPVHHADAVFAHRYGDVLGIGRLDQTPPKLRRDVAGLRLLVTARR